MSISFDYTAMFENVVGRGNGLSNAMIDDLREKFRATHTDLKERHSKGDLPFFDLPFRNESISHIESFVRSKGSRFRNFVQLGIGGSALGPIALFSSLKHPQHNLLPVEKRGGCRFFCPDNVDPDLVGAVLDVAKPEETLFHVVSKSGGTAETISQFLIILDLLKNQIGDNWRDHLVISTDPTKGSLREFCNDENIASFPIDPGVGGRFSILTSVGLLPAAMVGIDIRELCLGAGKLKDACFIDTFEENPAAMFAALLYLSQTRLSRPIQVVFAYSNRLYPLGDWFRQLWAESLGKRYSLSGEEIFTGPTPVKAIGATDQHSQVQLYVEGPADKVFIFLGTSSFERSIRIPAVEMGNNPPDYLYGVDLATLLNAERRATTYALSKAGRPNLTLELNGVNPQNVGGLMYLLETATLYAGGFYNVNPLDQPGVEAGKVATYALMGREGYEDKRAEMEAFPGMGDKVIDLEI